MSDVSLNTITTNMSDIIKLYNENSENILNNCTTSNKIKTSLGNPSDFDYERKINDIKTATNVIINIKKIIESNQNNYVNTIKAFKNFIINYNNKLSRDVNVKEMTDFTIAFNDLVNSISTNILNIQ